MQAFKNFRTYFFRGLAALLPTILTIWIFAQGYMFVKDNISEHVNRGVVKVLTSSFDWYPPVTVEQLEEYAIEQEAALEFNPTALQQKIRDEETIDGAQRALASYFLYKDKRTLLRLDIGMNRDGQTGIYFGVNEAF